MSELLNTFIDFVLFGAFFVPFILGAAVLFLIAWKTQDIWGDHFARFLGIEEGPQEEAAPEQHNPLQRYSA